MRARQHANMFAVQKALLGLWHKSEDKEVEVDLEKPVMYIDRLRIRPPGGWATHMRPQSFIIVRQHERIKTPHYDLSAHLTREAAFLYHEFYQLSRISALP